MPGNLARKWATVAFLTAVVSFTLWWSSYIPETIMTFDPHAMRELGIFPLPFRALTRMGGRSGIKSGSMYVLTGMS